MAIYTFLCKCGEITESVQSIREYSDPKTKRTPWHCNFPMERMLTVNGSNSAIAHALAGDRHYDGLAAPDGTLINSRTKHREYMKANGLTVSDDYKGEWKQAAKERDNRFNGRITDSKAMIEQAFTKAEQR